MKTWGTGPQVGTESGPGALRCRGWEGAGFPSSWDKRFPVPKWNPARLTLVNSSNPYPDRQEILWPMLGSL